MTLRVVTDETADECEICQRHPRVPGDIMCADCRQRVEDNLWTITDPVELVLMHHLPLPLGDGLCWCMCSVHGEGDHEYRNFDGPAYHRRHVAEKIRETLGLDPPTPWTQP